MKKTKVIFRSLILLITFFLSYDISLANGCCVININKSAINNCSKNSTKALCTQLNGIFYDEDAECNKHEIMKTRCVDASSTASTSSTSTATTSTTNTASTAANNTTSNTTTVVEFTNPLAFNSVEGFLQSFLTIIQRIIVILALVFVVLGALMIMTSAGSTDMYGKGRKTITYAVVGLAIAIAAPSILKEVAGILGWGSTSNAAVDSALTLSQIAMKVLNFLLGIAGILSLVMIVLGGIMYLTSAGDKDRAESGKKIFTYSLIGLVIIFSSMILLRQVAYFFVAG